MTPNSCPVLSTRLEAVQATVRKESDQLYGPDPAAHNELRADNWLRHAAHSSTLDRMIIPSKQFVEVYSQGCQAQSGLMLVQHTHAINNAVVSNQDRWMWDADICLKSHSY